MAEPLRARLQTGLRRAVKTRDTDAVAALRSALGAIDNAEAVPSPASATGLTAGPIAGARRGAGAGDAPRRSLSEDDIRAIVVAEIAELRASAAQYRRLGRHQQAERLGNRADLLDGLLSA